ncbi:hypothetical protein DIURU_002231 [Diutina rugosa]|uniref:Uncharacterized protein n=1 Tax=Diutina rugosa TaxID=5481 RepID=A0A642UR03_DIURU|nr:uncharacterized protein DIURU_002231 [Diutina rugosa]KAA8903719.1 hypothetical protein DIURU_002231 [Diutina rugosa]
MLARSALAAALRPLARTSFRTIQTVRDNAASEEKILTAQRANRPVSPHLKIYQPQLTWVLSGLHRITGVALAGAFYALTCTYAATSILDIPFSAASVVSAFASLPVAVKVLTKAAGAYPFFYHGLNGIRHLIWDTAHELTKKGVYRTGYAVLALTGLLGTYYTFF